MSYFLSLKNSFLTAFSLLIAFGCETSITQTKNPCVSDINITDIFATYNVTKKPLVSIDFSKNIDPDWVQKDAVILKHVLEEANTGLYRYNSKESIDSLFESIICGAQDSISYLTFIRQVAKVFNTIACGHSGWAHNPAYHAFRNTSMRFFPLRIYAINDQYFVKKNGSDAAVISMYDEILEINGRKPAEINMTLKNYMIKDGNSGLQGRSEISHYFPMAYSNFVDNPDTFFLKLKHHVSDEIYNVKIPALKLTSIDANLKSRNDPDEILGVPLRFNIETKSSSAIYTIKWFRNEYMHQHGQDFTAFTDSVFQIINDCEIKNLIIDLRGNAGGWTANGKHLFSYFIDSPTSYISKVEFNRVDSFSFNSLILNNIDLEDSMSYSVNSDGLKTWTNYPSLIAKPAQKNLFKGRVFILIDDMSRSCSSVFSSLMRSKTNAIFVGEETGGAQCGQNGMGLVIQLPYSGIIVNVSTAMYTCDVSSASDNRGIIPDYPVPTALNDIKEARDPQMEFILNKINQLITE